MRHLHVLVHSLLLATSPGLLAYPQQPIIQQVYNEEKPYDKSNLDYDAVLQLLQDIEEDKIPEEKLESTSHFVAFLAEQGMLPGEYVANAVLANDIAALLGKDNIVYNHFFPD